MSKERGERACASSWPRPATAAARSVQGGWAIHQRTLRTSWERLLTADEVAELLRVPQSTVYELARTGRLPFLKVGRCTRFERRALLNWIAAQTVQPKD